MAVVTPRANKRNDQAQALIGIPNWHLQDLQPGESEVIPTSGMDAVDLEDTSTLRPILHYRLHVCLPNA